VWISSLNRLQEKSCLELDRHKLSVLSPQSAWRAPGGVENIKRFRSHTGARSSTQKVASFRKSVDFASQRWVVGLLFGRARQSRHEAPRAIARYFPPLAPKASL
jgi:hypothetical protein